MRDGRVDPLARPDVATDGPVVRVDGRRAFGQLAARAGTIAAVGQARAFGVALAVVSGVKHVGRVGEYAEICAERDCIGLVFCNGGPSGGSVVPFGGATTAFGTNPLAYAFPVAGRAPVVADFSTSSVAEGKVRIYGQNGWSVPEGWIVRADGRPSTDPADFYAGGALLPAGGHKGYALGLLAEVLGGIVAREGCASTGADPGNGFVLFAIATDGEFPARAAEVVAALEAVPPAPGFDRVVVPGTLELEAQALHELDGITFSAETWRRFADTAESVGVEVPHLTPVTEEDRHV